MTAIARLGAVALDCRDPHRLAAFYSAVLDIPVDPSEEEADWVQLERRDGALLAFQLAPDHIPPVWPSTDHPQQVHLDLDVPDLDAGERAVVALGAAKHEYQPGTTFRVFLDPAGHPFCLTERPGLSLR